MPTNFLNKKFSKALSEEETIALFKAYHNNDESAYEKIIEHNIRLVIYIILKYFKNTSIPFDDLYSVGTYGLIKACKKFDEKKGIKFSSFATKVIKNEILMLFRKEKKHECVSSYNVKISDENVSEMLDLFSTDENIEEIYLDKELKQIVEKIIAKENNLTYRENVILNHIFGINGCSRKNQREISVILNLSQSYVSRILKQALLKIREEIKIYGYDIKTKNKQEVIGKSSETIYELFSENTYDEINEVIKTCLTLTEQKILLLYFGNNIENPQVRVNWDNKKDLIYFERILPKIKSNLEKLNEEIKKENNWKSISCTIYDVLKPYSKKQINLAIESLDESEKEILKKYYGEDFNKIVISRDILDDNEKELLKTITKKIIKYINQNKSATVKQIVVPKFSEVKKTTEKPEEKKEENIEMKPNKKGYVEPKVNKMKLIDFWNDDTFIELLKECSWEEITIISLKFGLASAKKYKISEIAMILDLKTEIVKDIINRFLIKYQMRINNYFEKIINEEDINHVRRRRKH